MSRIRLILGCILVAGLLGALTVPALSQAHEYKVEGKPVTSYTKFQSSGSFALAVIEGTPLGIKSHIECGLVNASGGLEPAGASKLALHWGECTIAKPARCEVSNGELPMQVSASLTSQSGGPLEDELTAETWGEWTYEGASCSLKAKTFRIGGSQTCVLEEVAVEEESHTLHCDIGGSHLKWGGKLATLEAWITGLHLVNENGQATKQSWSAS